jgi:hypothetical protein
MMEREEVPAALAADGAVLASGADHPAAGPTLVWGLP